MMRILVCGDRNWTDRECITRELLRYDSTSIIVQGCCRGADRMAAESARTLNLHYEGYAPDWERYGRAAGPIRNKQMLDTGIHLVLCFHNDISNSKGTRDMMDQALARGIEVKIITTTELGTSNDMDPLPEPQPKGKSNEE
ncbi:hypothetical protein LCGC14_2261460 [marine sediment metagenome]|uniref:YspA cpYpsA-related SLOG domain-containing protein n=1 Tax=marine sediment metagenome TaxID=412755 RepID=A0A0F9CZW2_9ZZZZ